MSFPRARRIADAILYEGYVLYPYRASSRKNRYRWTFGVVAPRAWTEAGGCEPSSATLECLIETRDGGPAPVVEGCLRFLQVERRNVEAATSDGGFRPVASLRADGEEHITWEEGVERELPFTLSTPVDGAKVLETTLPGSVEEHGLVDGNVMVGRKVRSMRPLDLVVTASTVAAGEGLLRLAITIENTSAIADVGAAREEAVASALVGAHLILSVREGEFVSLLDPPPAARTAAEGCRNVGLFPVLAGEPGTRTMLFASPIVLYDHPAIAAESPGESFDGTEIDELLTLSTRSLTDEEKREARATSPRAAEVIDRAERLSDEALMSLHGKTTRAPFGRGSRVRVRLGAPTGARRTDAQDMFLQGRIGVVEEVREDVDGGTHVAIVLEDDPGADLHRWYGRHLHFRPEELELVEQAERAP
ncbi:MAG TPA: hypothetical protein VN947_29705 [Polyangia bacterium]|nr:hypothetical protein [Polyangia bacterium]